MFNCSCLITPITVYWLLNMRNWKLKCSHYEPSSHRGKHHESDRSHNGFLRGAPVKYGLKGERLSSVLSPGGTFNFCLHSSPLWEVVHMRAHTDPIIFMFVPAVEYGFLCVYNMMWELCEGMDLNIVLIATYFVSSVMLSLLINDFICT